MTEARTVKIAGGIADNGVVIGNTFDKYGSTNPIVRWMVDGFSRALTGFVRDANPSTIHEVGCGEGFWACAWAAEGRVVKGTDFSAQVIELARSNAVEGGIDPSMFKVRSISDVEPGRDSADLVVCCEVMEHIDDPDRAFRALTDIVKRDLIVSAPREPLWRLLNMARGKYMNDFGNTPGHVNHWSSAGIRRLAARHFDIVAMATPLPWTMLHCRPKAVEIRAD